MTSLRRRLLNGVGGALLIISLFGAGCQSHTATEAIGKLSRDDTIAYLVLSDQLTPIRESVKVPFTVCISTGTQSQMQTGYPDPSGGLMARLISENALHKGTLALHPASDCESSSSAVIDRSSGRNAFFVYSTDAGHPDCGELEGGWHGGPLYGGGNYYSVWESADEISVTRSDNCWFAE